MCMCVYIVEKILVIGSLEKSTFFPSGKSSLRWSGETRINNSELRRRGIRLLVDGWDETKSKLFRT